MAGSAFVCQLCGAIPRYPSDRITERDNYRYDKGNGRFAVFTRRKLCRSCASAEADRLEAGRYQLILSDLRCFHCVPARKHRLDRRISLRREFRSDLTLATLRSVTIERFCVPHAEQIVGDERPAPAETASLL